MQRILITGANGFVGQILCKALQQAGQHVIVLAGPASSPAAQADEHLDIRDAAALAQAVERAAPTAATMAVALTEPMLSIFSNRCTRSSWRAWR